MRCFRRPVFVARFGLAALSAGFSAKGDVNVVEYHNNPSRDGLYVDPAFTTAASAGLQRDLTFDGTISGNVNAQPLYIEGGPGGRAVVIVVTQSDNIYALDATDGTIIWERNVGDPVPLSAQPCGNIDPLGIAGTPVVDLPSRSLFFDALTPPDLGTTSSQHTIYSLNVDTGTTNIGWPVDVSATVTFGSTVFQSDTQNQRGALGVLLGTLYVPYGGHWGDCGTYHGWLVGIPLSNPAGVTAWATAADGGGSWSAGGVASDGAVAFIATGNTFNANDWGGGEAILRMQPGPSFTGLTADYWVPPNWEALDNGDVDIGGSGPLLVNVPGATPSQLIVALGKDGNAYLLSRANLGGVSAPLAQLHVSNNEIIQAAATYQTTQGTYVVFEDGSQLTAFRVTPTSPPTIINAWSASQNGYGSPFVTSTDGTNNVIVWGVGCEGDERLHGFDGDTGAVVYSGGGINEAMAGTRHMNTAIAARGHIYVANDDKVYAFTLASLPQPVPPIITAQPSNQAALPGSSASFQVSASGTSPVSYQWMFNGATISGATDTTLTLANVQPTQAGNYAVAVTNVAGAITSSWAQLTVVLPPSITMQPVNQTVLSGADVTFDVAASGTPPLSYQWFFNGTNLVGTGNTLSISGVQPSQAGSYSAVVSSPYGSVPSVAATLTVLGSPTIINQPASQTVATGANASFQVSASGTAPLSYQWMFSGTNLSGATNTTLTLANVQTAQAGSYAVVVTNVAGAITSSWAQLTVVLLPSITLQPADQTVVSGANVTFDVAASGTSPLSYQWILNGTNLVGTGNTLSISDVQPSQAGSYSAVVSSPYGSIPSVAATLTVLTSPTIINQPASQTVAAGASVGFQVSASGAAPLSYQWMFNGTIISGATDTTLTLANVQTAQAGSYAVAVTNVAGAITSSWAQLTLVVPPTITLQPANQTVVSGANVTFDVAASGIAPLGYQWFFNGINPVGTGNTLSISDVQPSQAGNYSVIVSDLYGSVFSIAASLTVLTPPTIINQPTNQIAVAAGDTSFQVSASGTAPLSYQWMFNGTNLSGANDIGLSLTNIQTTEAGSYAVVVANVAGAVTSSWAQLTILLPPAITTQPGNQTVVSGANVNFEVAASGTPPLSYQWVFNGINLVGTGNILSISDSQPSQAGNYSVMVSNPYGSTFSLAASLTVLIPPTINTQPTSQTVAAGTDTSFQVFASGTAPLSYQWMVNGTILSGATVTALSLKNVQTSQAGSYIALVTNAAGSVTSAVARLTVLAPPALRPSGWLPPTEPEQAQ